VQEALDIIEKYAEAVEVKISQRCLPTRSLSKMNIHLKLIAAYSGVDAILTTKYARRFFRQSVSAAGITEPHVVKTIMGHNISNEMDVHYLTVTDNMLQTAKSQLEQRFNAMGS
jgi:intergrase/recombinase